MELRWLVRSWEEYRDGLQTGVYRREEPVLQYRQEIDVLTDGNHFISEMCEWVDVPTEYEEG